MSGLNIDQQQRPAPRHPLYVSIQNGAIQQAMSSPSGYEDEHPEDWRPATFAEREQFLAGVDNIAGNPQPMQLPQFAATEQATPSSLTMAPDDDEPVVIIAPVIVPPPPAPAIVPSAPPPAPAAAGTPAPPAE